MLIIIDSKIPDQAKDTLSAYGELIEFATGSITYNAVSGHPDIFFCMVRDRLVVAPNIPDEYLGVLKDNGINFVIGVKPVSGGYPGSAYYNAVVSEKFLIHRQDITDPVILELSNHLERISVRQGYCRCNLFSLDINVKGSVNVRAKKNSFITSDRGIYKALENLGNAFYVSPEDIILPEFRHGFFGGACGVYADRVFIIGSLNFIKAGDDIRYFLNNQGYEIIELYNGPLYDGGSILFV